MKKRIYNILIVIFSLIFLFSATMLIVYYADGALQRKRYGDLASLKETVTPRPTIPPEGADTPEQPEQPEPTGPQLVEVTDPKTGQTRLILPEFVELYQQNSDIVAWLSIPGTVIDYPVMQTPDNRDYYLRRTFDRKRNTRGCLYIWPESDVFTPSDNVTIYGHRMRDGSMFGQLEKYRKPAFRAEHPYIHFDSLTELHTYEVMAVFLTTASVGKGFAYHAFVDAESPEEFDAFVDQCKQLSLYDTGVTAEYGDKLICLSTCEYSQVNGRLVVVAKRIA